MKAEKYIATICVASALSACSSLGTQFKSAEEAADGPRARLRVSGNVLVKAVPNKDCIDWSAPGAGTVLGGIVGASGYRGRSLGMPGAEKLGRAPMGELYVAAEQPFTLVLLTTPESRQQCSVAATFVPKADVDYEARLVLEKGACVASVSNVSGEPVRLTRAQACQ
ncbi:hypothetical protein [Ralstonia flatus]|jgi:hypothetical protein|uniref:hypothetical protein n=1 Tax=Ralstonia flatus TaxID=3058601 RepID=UPI0019811593|nr:hypothetical protein [Ralstonia sp. LMG 32965]MBN6208261.1 hypothetical protein [Ralstonia pickettii]